MKSLWPTLYATPYSIRTSRPGAFCLIGIDFAELELRMLASLQTVNKSAMIRQKEGDTMELRKWLRKLSYRDLKGELFKLIYSAPHTVADVLKLDLIQEEIDKRRRKTSERNKEA